MRAQEWDWIERGLKQRVTALNLFLADIYGPQECIKAGIIPGDLVYRNPHYRLEMRDFEVPHGKYVHIAGIDIVRTGRVRRAKLYYLRELKGKAARLRERE